MLMRPNKTETAVHGCHCPDAMAVRMPKVLARPWVVVRVCHLLLLLLFEEELFRVIVILVSSLKIKNCHWRLNRKNFTVSLLNCLQ